MDTTVCTEQRVNHSRSRKRELILRKVTVKQTQTFCDEQSFLRLIFLLHVSSLFCLCISVNHVIAFWIRLLRIEKKKVKINCFFLKGKGKMLSIIGCVKEKNIFAFL